MAMQKRVAAGLGAAFVVVVAVTGTNATAQAPKVALPFDAELVKPLGFRSGPTLTATPVFPQRNYLQPPTRVKLLTVTGSLGAPGAFCKAESLGQQGYLRCDDMTAFKAAAVAPATPSLAAPSGRAGEVPFTRRNRFGVSCRTFEQCKDYCKAACDILPTGGSKCDRIATTGDGLLPPSSPLLKDLKATLPEKDMKHVKIDGRERATDEVIAGLRKLDAWLAASPERAKHNYSVVISNCWRDGTEENKKECWFVNKGIDPQKEKMLALPGANAHSSGKACDLYLVDAAGKRAMDVCSGNERTGAAIDAKTASRLLDDALTNAQVGAVRLNYEPWHYEWGGTSGGSTCRCKGPDCNASFWPPLCNPSGCAVRR